MSSFDLSTSWHADHKENPSIFVSGLPSELSQSDLASVFEQYGRIKEIRMAKDTESKRFLGYGFIEYENPLSAILAVDNLDRILLRNRSIRVSHAKPQAQGTDKRRKDDSGAK